MPVWSGPGRGGGTSPEALADAIEAGRLAALDRYAIMDTGAEPAFDRLARTAARLADMPIALVTLVDAQRAWFKARVGTGLTEIPRTAALCAEAIHTDDVVVVEDAATDPRVAGTARAVAGLPIGSYAGAPLITADGHRLGALCVMAAEPRPIPGALAAGLRDLAAAVVDALELRRARDRLAALALNDPMTGVANRRHFFEAAAREMARMRRYGQPVTAMVLDIDRFRHINDRFGQDVGDQALIALAGLAVATLRGEDLFGRVGGEEFGAVLPQTALEPAREVAERLRRLAGEIRVDTPDGACGFTISVGLSPIEPQDDSFETALRRADAALARAKIAGRNRVEVA